MPRIWPILAVQEVPLVAWAPSLTLTAQLQGSYGALPHQLREDAVHVGVDRPVKGSQWESASSLGQKHETTLVPPGASQGAVSPLPSPQPRRESTSSGNYQPVPSRTQSLKGGVSGPPDTSFVPQELVSKLLHLHFKDDKTKGARTGGWGGGGGGGQPGTGTLHCSSAGPGPLATGHEAREPGQKRQGQKWGGRERACP